MQRPGGDDVHGLQQKDLGQRRAGAPPQCFLTSTGSSHHIDLSPSMRVPTFRGGELLPSATTLCCVSSMPGFANHHSLFILQVWIPQCPTYSRRVQRASCQVHGACATPSAVLPRRGSGLSFAAPTACSFGNSTLKRSIMKSYKKAIPRIHDQLRSAGSKISVTLDCWTSPNTRAFLGITGHSIDTNWSLHSLVLGFVPLPHSHTGEELC